MPEIWVAGLSWEASGASVAGSGAFRGGVSPGVVPVLALRGGALLSMRMQVDPTFSPGTFHSP